MWEIYVFSTGARQVLIYQFMTCHGKYGRYWHVPESFEGEGI